MRLLGFIHAYLHPPLQAGGGLHPEPRPGSWRGLRAPGCSTIKRPHVELEALGLNPYEPVVSAVDASGIKVSNRGE
ncbi:MAG: hypothetical protein QW057_01410 [Candidatus Bathyarchaeia archaeon]